MRPMCKHNTWRTYTIRKGSQVVLNKNTTKMLPRRGRRSGKEKIRK
jgi:hypothetical protein